MSESPIDYPRGLTFEKVWAVIQEDHKRFQDNLDKFSTKYNAIFDRIAEERKVYEEQQKAEYKKQKKEYKKQKKETEKRVKKMEESVDKTTRSVDILNANMGGLNNRFGELAEHMVAPNLLERFNELGYHFTRVIDHRKITENGQTIAEIDFILENKKVAVVVEVKAKPTINDVKNHIKRIQIVRSDFEKQGKEIIGAIAGAIFIDNVKAFTIKTGFYAITQSGDTVKIDVPKDFKPRIF
jgi:hypothetical protein